MENATAVYCSGEFYKSISKIYKSFLKCFVFVLNKNVIIAYIRDIGDYVKQFCFKRKKPRTVEIYCFPYSWYLAASYEGMSAYTYYLLAIWVKNSLRYACALRDNDIVCYVFYRIYLHASIRDNK